jgi:hypothetical protein
MNASNGNGTLVASPTELSRIIRLLTGKGGGGNLPFPKIDLSIEDTGGGAIRAFSEHANALETAMVRVSWPTDGAGAFALALSTPEKMIDYLEGLCIPDVPVELRYDESLGRLDLANGTNRIALPTIPFGDVPRSKREGLWTTTSEGVAVSSDPKKRPDEGASLTDYPAKGFLVARISRTTLERVLAAGSIILSHGFRAALVRFSFAGGKGAVEIADPKDPKGERVDLALPTLGITPTVDDTFPVLYSGVDSLWESLRKSKADEFTLVHFAGRDGEKPESRVNLAFEEKAEDGRSLLRYTQVFATHRDPRAKKEA